jgi:hypothetical protein
VGQKFKNRPLFTFHRIEKPLAFLSKKSYNDFAYPVKSYLIFQRLAFCYDKYHFSHLLAQLDASISTTLLYNIDRRTTYEQCHS